MRDVGWKRVDPTDVIAPERINSGLESYLQSRAAAERFGGAETSTMVVGLRDLLREFRLAWDSLSYQWDLRVLNFDEENQRSFFVLIGLSHLDRPVLITGSVLGSAALLAFLGLWLFRRPRAHRDVIARYYDRFCRTLAAAACRANRLKGHSRFPSARRSISRSTRIEFIASACSTSGCATPKPPRNQPEPHARSAPSAE